MIAITITKKPSELSIADLGGISDPVTVIVADDEYVTLERVDFVGSTPISCRIYEGDGEVMASH